MTLMPPDEALARATAGIKATDAEDVPIDEAHGRILAADIAAKLTQPPFPSSAMDGFAVRAADVNSTPARLRLIGEAAAGHAFAGSVGAGEAVRIFTGAPVPEGADTIIIQENARWQDKTVEVLEPASPGSYIRPRGLDFREGETLLRAGKRLNARDILLAAAMNYASLPVRRKPRIAILATGDELVKPGGQPRADQIVSSVPSGLAAMIARAGGTPEMLGIAADTRESLECHLAGATNADLIVTIGGVSVGSHDLVRPVLEAQGCVLEFWKIAMRPGKPLLFGRRGAQRVLGLPGNPVSAMICTRIFIYPIIHAMLGASGEPTQPQNGMLARAVEANGARRHYMRGVTVGENSGIPVVDPIPDQDSSLVSALVSSDCLIIREANAPAASAGDSVQVLPLDF